MRVQDKEAFITAVGLLLIIDPIEAINLVASTAEPNAKRV